MPTATTPSHCVPQCDADFEVWRWVDTFDCGLEEVYRRNPWHKGRSHAKKGEIFDLVGPF